LRDTSSKDREYPEPKVEEYFEEGREITDEENLDTQNNIDFDNEGDT
jgi:hypothetical protein